MTTRISCEYVNMITTVSVNLGNSYTGCQLKNIDYEIKLGYMYIFFLRAVENGRLYTNITSMYDAFYQFTALFANV